MPDAADRADYSDTERAIFDAALEEFARKGRDGARMQAIADAADINKSMLHYYFRSKDQLYEEVFSFTMRRFMESFGASLHQASTFAETLRAFIDAYVDFVRDHQDAMRLMVNENMAGGSMVGRNIKQKMKADEGPPAILADRIASAAEAGEIRAVDPHHTVLTIISGCLFFFVMAPTVRIIHPDANDWDAFVEARKSHLFETMYHGLKADDASSSPSC
jgi:TetR/AcrR family transcriptional regulator